MRVPDNSNDDTAKFNTGMIKPSATLGRARDL